MLFLIAIDLDTYVAGGFEEDLELNWLFYFLLFLN